MTPKDKVNLQRLIRKYIDPESRVLDVGCGTGDNLDFLRELGFKSLVGTDISSSMVECASSKGHEVYSSEDIVRTGKRFDVLLFSHVIEHIEYQHLQSFLETYFSMLSSRTGYAIILAPVLYDGFYNDVDHIKPYYAEGLKVLFSRNDVSRQYESEYSLELVDIHYRRQSALPFNMRCRMVRSNITRMHFLLLRVLFAAAYYGSFGLIGKTTGYAALFKVSHESSGL